MSCVCVCGGVDGWKPLEVRQHVWAFVQVTKKLKKNSLQNSSYIRVVPIDAVPYKIYPRKKKL